jgi:hypothetical protein
MGHIYIYIGFESLGITIFPKKNREFGDHSTRRGATRADRSPITLLFT